MTDAHIITLDKPKAEIVRELDVIFYSNNIVMPVDYDSIKGIKRDYIRYYCQERGIYLIVTYQLINFLKKLIDRRQAIEIGAGNGTLSLGLNIKGTDSYQQDNPELALRYLLQGQKVINYPFFVERLDAISAIQKYNPEVVVGSWVTHKYKFAEHHLEGNPLGPYEEEIMQLCDTYILIGNEYVHANNRLLNNSKKYKVRKHKPYGLISRSARPELDCIFEITKVCQ